MKSKCLTGRVAAAMAIAAICSVSAAMAQLPILSNAFIRAGRGLLLGTPTNFPQPGVIGYDSSTDTLQMWNVANNAFGPISIAALTNLVLQPVSATNNYLSYSNSSSQPRNGYLTYCVTNGGGGTVTNLIAQPILGVSSNYLIASNQLSNLFIRYSVTNDGSGKYLPLTGGTVNGNVTINGNLTVNGTQTITTAYTINTYTQYNIGTFTNYYATTVYSTNIVYETTELVIQTNITYSTIDAYAGWNFIGAYLNATGAPYVYTPHFRDTLTNNLVANGTWDFSGANLIGVTNLLKTVSWSEGSSNNFYVLGGTQAVLMVKTNYASAVTNGIDSYVYDLGNSNYLSYVGGVLSVSFKTNFPPSTNGINSYVYDLGNSNHLSYIGGVLSVSFKTNYASAEVDTLQSVMARGASATGTLYGDYVFNATATFTGGTLSAKSPTTSSEVATKGYVDSGITASVTNAISTVAYAGVTNTGISTLAFSTNGAVTNILISGNTALVQLQNSGSSVWVINVDGSLSPNTTISSGDLFWTYDANTNLVPR